MTLIRLTHCENFETTACRIFEQIDGLQSRAEQRLSRRSHTQSTLVLTNPSPRQLITPTLEEVGEVVLASDEYNENGGNRDAKTPTNKRRYLANRLMGFVRDKQWSRLRIPRRRHAHRPGVAGEPIGLVIDGKTLTFALQVSHSEGNRSSYNFLCLFLVSFSPNGFSIFLTRKQNCLCESSTNSVREKDEKLCAKSAQVIHF